MSKNKNAKPLPPLRIPPTIIAAVNNIFEQSKALKEAFDEFNKSVDQWELDFPEDKADE